MEQQSVNKKEPSITISTLIDQIQFTKNKPRKKKMSDSDSLSSATSFESKQKSKIWTEEEEQFFQILLKTYGTDFSILNMFFPKKTKNQIKVILYQARTNTNKRITKIKSKPKNMTLSFRQQRTFLNKQNSTSRITDLLKLTVDQTTIRTNIKWRVYNYSLKKISLNFHIYTQSRFNQLFNLGKFLLRCRLFIFFKCKLLELQNILIKEPIFQSQNDEVNNKISFIKFIIQMNFYQQKYFKPYHQIVSSPERYRQQNFRTPSTHKYRQKQRFHYSDKPDAQPVWQYLYNEGLKSQQKLQQKHEVTKHKIDIECTFKPMIKHNKRYLLPSHSTFLQRNNVWMENKIQKIVKEKQQEINKGLKQCTFAPIINSKSKKTRPDKYENTIHKKNCPNEKLHKSTVRPSRGAEQDKVQDSLASGPSGKKPSYVQISRAKQMIRNELKRLVL